MWNEIKNGSKLMITNEGSIGKGLNTLILEVTVSIGNLPWLKDWEKFRHWLSEGWWVGPSKGKFFHDCYSFI